MIFYWQITKISCIFALRNGNDNGVLKEILSKICMSNFVYKNYPVELLKKIIETAEKDATFFFFCILIGPENHRGKGLGQIIMQQLLDFGYQHFPNKSAELNVFDWNIGAIKCYEKIGFKLNPEIKKEVQIGNEIWTSVNMILD